MPGRGGRVRQAGNGRLTGRAGVGAPGAGLCPLAWLAADAGVDVPDGLVVGAAVGLCAGVGTAVGVSAGDGVAVGGCAGEGVPAGLWVGLGTAVGVWLGAVGVGVPPDGAVVGVADRAGVGVGRCLGAGRGVGLAAEPAVGPPASYWYRLYCRIRLISLAPYPGSVAYTPVSADANALGARRTAIACW